MPKILLKKQRIWENNVFLGVTSIHVDEDSVVVIVAVAVVQQQQSDHGTLSKVVGGIDWGFIWVRHMHAWNTT